MPIWLLVCCALGRKEALRRENLEEGRPLGLLPLKNGEHTLSSPFLLRSASQPPGSELCFSPSHSLFLKTKGIWAKN